MYGFTALRIAKENRIAIDGGDRDREYSIARSRLRWQRFAIAAPMTRLGNLNPTTTRRKNLTQTMAELALKLRYFPARARGESIRMLLKHAKIPFEDIIIRGPEFMQMKPKLPTGQLPVLEVRGKDYPESGSILRFVGHISATIPEDPVRFLNADAAFEVARGMSTIDPIVNRFEGDTLTEQYKSYYEKLPDKLKYLSDALGEMLFYGGDRPCYADFGIWHYLDNTETVKSGSVTPQNLVNWMKRLASLPEVEAYLASRPPLREERRALIATLGS